MPDFIHIHPNDNVAVALHPIAAGTKFMGIAAKADIPQGHKMALKALAEGDQVMKYGFSIGHAIAPVEAGADLLALVLEVASGKQTKTEQKGYREISIFKDGVVL